MNAEALFQTAARRGRREAADTGAQLAEIARLVATAGMPRAEMQAKADAMFETVEVSLIDAVRVYVNTLRDDFARRMAEIDWRVPRTGGSA